MAACVGARANGVRAGRGARLPADRHLDVQRDAATTRREDLLCRLTAMTDRRCPMRQRRWCATSIATTSGTAPPTRSTSAGALRSRRAARGRLELVRAAARPPRRSSRSCRRAAVLRAGPPGFGAESQPCDSDRRVRQRRSARRRRRGAPPSAAVNAGRRRSTPPAKPTSSAQRVTPPAPTVARPGRAGRGRRSAAPGRPPRRTPVAVRAPIAYHLCSSAPQLVPHERYWRSSSRQVRRCSWNTTADGS